MKPKHTNMKRSILLLLFIASIGLVSCKKEVYVPSDTTNLTILSDIFPKDWVRSPDGLSYYTRISVPENDTYYNQNGAIVVAMSFENLDVYEALPQTYKGYSYRFTYQPGYVTIYLNDPYGDPVNAPTFESTAKITLLDSKLIK